jgi:hypothetical protein
MAGSQDAVTDTFMSLIAQKASAEIILEVLVDEAALLFPGLTRPDLEFIAMGVLEEARERSGGRRTRTNILRFPNSESPKQVA